MQGSKLLSRKGLDSFLSGKIASISAGQRVLNVGAGGDFARVLQAGAVKNGFTVTNVDIDPSRHPDVVDDITQSSFQDESFDAIVMLEVLEHVVNPIGAASEVLRLLKPNGQLILSTPFIFPLHDRPHDFFRYTKYGLTHLFKELVGLEIRERNSWAEAILVLLVRLIFEGGRRYQIASLFLIPIAVLCVPLAVLVSAILPTDFLTTGYILSGTKRVPSEILV